VIGYKWATKKGLVQRSAPDLFFGRAFALARMVKCVNLMNEKIEKYIQTQAIETVAIALWVKHGTVGS